MLERHVPGDVGLAGDTVNNMWLCQPNITVVLLLYVDYKLIVYVYLVFNV